MPKVQKKAVTDFSQPLLCLNFRSKGKITCVAQAGNYISLGSKLLIDVAAPYGNMWFCTLNEFNTNGACNCSNNMYLFGLAFFPQKLDCFYQGRTCGDHGIRNDQYP